MAAIGSRIKAKRNELGLSQRELAARLGYKDHTTLTRIEAGKVELSQSNIVKFAKVLGVKPGYLMGWEEKPEEFGALAAEVLKDPELLQLVKNYRELSAADRATVSALVSSLAIKKD